MDSEFVITSASPAPGTRDCMRVVHMRARWLTYVRVPLHGEGDGQHVTRPRKSGPCGAVAGMAVVGGCPTTMHDGPAARRIRAVGHNLFIRPMRLRPVTGPGGQTTDRAAPRRSRQTASVHKPETTFCRGGVPEAPHTHGGAFLGGPLVGGGSFLIQPGRKTRYFGKTTAPAAFMYYSAHRLWPEAPQNFLPL